MNRSKDVKNSSTLSVVVYEIIQMVLRYQNFTILKQSYKSVICINDIDNIN
jgi:hypothetical protein